MNPIENWEPFMTRREAVALAKSLAAKGMRQVDISQKLADAGYRNAKTNNPVSGASISIMVNDGRRGRKTTPKRGGSEGAPQKARGIGGKSAAVRSILKLKGMAAEERIALALLVLE